MSYFCYNHLGLKFLSVQLRESEESNENVVRYTSEEAEVMIRHILKGLLSESLLRRSRYLTTS
jgi:hypothetical protein